MTYKSAQKNIASTSRIWELDFIRGFCVFMMICDHTLFDLGFVFQTQWFPQGGDNIIATICNFASDFYWGHPIKAIVRNLVLVGFIGICGISCSFSRSNLKRGLRLLVIALALTAVTALMDKLMGVKDNFIIRFGVLHLLSVSILAYWALGRLPRWLVLGLGAVLAALGLCFSANPIEAANLFVFILGLGGGAYSADYFPLLPYLGFFLMGASLGSLIYPQKVSYFPKHGHGKALRPFMFLGSHALLIYVVHQPLIYGLLLALGLFFAS